MESRIALLPETLLVGKCLRMALANNRTVELWKSFMPHRAEIQNIRSPVLYSVQRYDGLPGPGVFNPSVEFEKWAAVEVTGFGQIPEGMCTLTIPGGLYAVFQYKGSPQEFAKAFDFIFRSWFPDSGYVLDNREHFEIMGDKYKNNDPSSEEEIWIPLAPRAGS